MKIETSSPAINVHFFYEKGDEEALTQTEIILKQIVSALQKEDCRVMKSVYNEVTLDELKNALYTIQNLLYEVPDETKAW